jgi:hypothetical protein
MTSVLMASVICWVRRFWSSAEISAGNFFVGSRKGVGVDDALTLDGEFLDEEADGHLLVLTPARRTSVVWVRTRGI